MCWYGRRLIRDSERAYQHATAAGTVDFRQTGTAAGSFSGSPCTLTTVNATTASCSASFNPTGQGTVIASGAYTASAADTAHANSSGTSNTVTVGPRATTTIVTCSPTTIVVAQSTSCTAFVKDTAGVGTASTPAGTVSFSNTGTATGSFSGSPCTLTTINATTASCSASISPTGQGTVIVS